MKKDHKIIIFGFGSIGRRHDANLMSLGYKNITVFDPYYRGDNKKVLKKIDPKMLKDFKVAFICSPNNFHIDHALLCAKNGINLFIEKPLSHNARGIKELERLCRQKRLVSMVGCNMRFHPCLQFIKKYLQGGRLGKIYSIMLEFGYYLPYWRPGQDYRKNYAVKKQTGGGIILDDIHEFDLLFWLNGFSRVIDSKFIYNRAGSLKIETEDNCLASFGFANQVLGLVKCDYLQKCYSRSCKIVGESGNICWNFRENIVWRENEKGRAKLFQSRNYDLNRAYTEEIKYFFTCLDKRTGTFNDIKTAGKILNYCLER